MRAFALIFTYIIYCIFIIYIYIIYLHILYIGNHFFTKVGCRYLDKSSHSICLCTNKAELLHVLIAEELEEAARHV